LNILTISYQEIGCQIEINKKGQIRSAGFKPLGWYMLWKSQGYHPVDMLFFTAEIKGSPNEILSGAAVCVH
jgi:hypothetical protein